MPTPLEQISGPSEAISSAINAFRAALFTALPGIVQSFDPVKCTAVVQPCIQGVLADAEGKAALVSLPLLPDVPVVFPGGGGCALTFPVAEGDECLVVFSSRCIDAWWQSGGVQPPLEPRYNDLSDGFALVGVRSVPRVPVSLSTAGVQLRTDDGRAYIQLDPRNHDIELLTLGSVAGNVGGNVTLTAAQFTLNGPLQVNGKITATGTITAPLVVGTTNVTFGGKSGTGHIHTGGTNAGKTGPVV